MSGHQPANGPSKIPCARCREPMNADADICHTCKSYVSWWRGSLSYYASVASGVMIIFTAALYVPSGIETLRKAFWSHNEVKIAYFEYPGNVGFFNNGDYDIVVQSVTVSWPGNFNAKAINLPVGIAIKPGEIQSTHIDLQYAEPEGIKTNADWVFGAPPATELADAFAIGDVNRCSVFHLFSVKHPSLTTITDAYRERQLATVQANVQVNVLYVKTNLMGRPEEISEPEVGPSFDTAFLKMRTCPASPVLPKRAGDPKVDPASAQGRLAQH